VFYPDFSCDFYKTLPANDIFCQLSDKNQTTLLLFWMDPESGFGLTLDIRVLTVVLFQ